MAMFEEAILNTKDVLNMHVTHDRHHFYPMGLETHHMPPSTYLEFYGFAMYLTSFIAFIAYIVWAYEPGSILHEWGLTYYPEKHWSISLPAYLLSCLMFLVIFNFGYTLYHTPTLESFHIIAGKCGLFRRG